VAGSTGECSHNDLGSSAVLTYVVEAGDIAASVHADTFCLGATFTWTCTVTVDAAGHAWVSTGAPLLAHCFCCGTMASAGSAPSAEDFDSESMAFST